MSGDAVEDDVERCGESVLEVGVVVLGRDPSDELALVGVEQDAGGVVRVGASFSTRPIDELHLIVDPIAVRRGKRLFEHCAHVTGPFFHGTNAQLAVGELLAPGFRSHYQNRKLRHVSFAARVETAAWGAQLATALAGSAERGHIYVVQPLGAFGDDPNVTNKRFPGNPTESYRTLHPLRILSELGDWTGHDADVLRTMLDT